MANPLLNRIIELGGENPRSLVAHASNPNCLSQSERDALLAILESVGWITPVIVNRRTGHLLAGHAVAELAIERGERSIPVLYVDVTEAEEGMLYAHARNATRDGPRGNPKATGGHRIFGARSP